jgi:hypothetical protein
MMGLPLSAWSADFFEQSGLFDDVGLAALAALGTNIA